MGDGRLGDGGLSGGRLGDGGRLARRGPAAGARGS
jgi:hypothetical protein